MTFNQKKHIYVNIGYSRYESGKNVLLVIDPLKRMYMYITYKEGFGLSFYKHLKS